MGDWRKSTYSDATGGNCVEVATRDQAIAVRDTANCNGATLTFTAQAWQRFADALKQPPSPPERTYPVSRPCG